ncbi:response regulator [Vallitaleaceae bacterium 9-2]
MYKLLIVDDETLEREALRYIINNSELQIMEIAEAADGLSAVDVAKKFDPDIAILDIKMPGLDGLEVGHILKKQKPEIKIIFMTAFDSFEYAHEAIKIGVEEFIVKPASKDKTLEIIEVCIQKLENDKRLQEQKENLEVKLNQISFYLENEFVNSVANGEIDEQDADEYLKFMVNEFIEGFGVVVEIGVLNQQKANTLHRNMINKRFVDKLSTLLTGNIKFLMSQLKNTIYILVFNYEPDERLNIIRTIEDEIHMVSEDVNEQLDLPIYYGFGEPYKQISSLWKSFAQAKASARNMLIDLVDNADDVSVNISSTDFKEHELCVSIFNGNEEEMIRIADYILETIIYANNDMNAIRLRLYEFFILLNRYLNKESQLKHAVPDHIFDDIKDIESQGEAKRYIHRYLYGILEEIEAQKDNKTTTVLDKAIEYIEKNYDQSITLEDVAFEIGFSTFYFGKMFKKTYKSSFTDYLTHVRIAKAKDLLRIGQLTVKDITYRVGYMDPNYFTRVFKKSEGITPTEYRTKFLSPE